MQIEAIYSAPIVGGERLKGNLARNSHLTDEMFHKLWEDGWVSGFPINHNLTSSQAEQVIQSEPHEVASISKNAQLSDEFFLKLFHYYDDNENLTTVVNLAGNSQSLLDYTFSNRNIQLDVVKWTDSICCSMTRMWIKTNSPETHT